MVLNVSSKLFYIGMSVMERAADPFQECREKFLDTFGRSCLFWLPAQSVNFMWVPPQFRVVYIGACALVWVNILCWVKRQTFRDSGVGHTMSTTDSAADVNSKAAMELKAL